MSIKGFWNEEAAQAQEAYHEIPLWEIECVASILDIPEDESGAMNPFVSDQGNLLRLLLPCAFIVHEMLAILTGRAGVIQWCSCLWRFFSTLHTRGIFGSLALQVLVIGIRRLLQRCGVCCGRTCCHFVDMEKIWWWKRRFCAQKLGWEYILANILQ